MRGLAGTFGPPHRGRALARLGDVNADDQPHRRGLPPSERAGARRVDAAGSPTPQVNRATSACPPPCADCLVPRGRSSPRTWARALLVVAGGARRRDASSRAIPPSSARSRGPILASLTSWDGWWYLGIARNGYHAAPLSGQYHDYAFFPLYPALVRVLSLATPAFDGLIAVLLSNALFLVSLWLLYRLTADVLDEERALWSCVLLCLFPFSWVFSMAYGESLFLALSLGSLLAAERGRAGWASVLAALAGLTRLPGVLLIVPLALILWRRAARPPCARLAGDGSARRRRLRGVGRQVRRGAWAPRLRPVGVGAKRDRHGRGRQREPRVPARPAAALVPGDAARVRVPPRVPAPRPDPARLRPDPDPDARVRVRVAATCSRSAGSGWWRSRSVGDRGPALAVVPGCLAARHLDGRCSDPERCDLRGWYHRDRVSMTGRAERLPAAAAARRAWLAWVPASSVSLPCSSWRGSSRAS